MSKRKTPRKTLAETKAEYRSYGFGEAYAIVAEIMRNDFWGRFSRSPRAAEHDPRHKAIMEICLALDKRASELDAEYKRIMFPRVYRRDFDAVRKEGLESDPLREEEC